MSTFDATTAQFGPELLISPSAETAEQLRLLPLVYFSDDGIHTMDYRTWDGAERHYLESEREHLDKLTGQIQKYGILDRIEIAWHGPGYLPHMYDGHHRIVILRRLGWTHAPYRWWNPGARTFGDIRWETAPFPWTPPADHPTTQERPS